MYSEQERARRLNAAAEVIKKEGLQAIYLLGNGTVGTNAFGNFRYFVDNRVFFFFSSAIITADGNLFGVVNNTMGKLNLIKSSFVKDVITNVDQLGGVIGFLKEKGLDKGKLGVLFEIMPAPWFLRLSKELPELELVDVSKQLFEVRTVKSDEEADTLRQCGKVADAGYKAAIEAAKPGAYEHEVVAAAIGAMQKMGADGFFMLIASGKFSATENKLTTLHNVAGIDRQLEKGDSVAMEITPYFNGNWTQLVRTISVGEGNPDADEFRRVNVKAVGEAVKLIKPGVPVKEVVLKMKEEIEKEGYRLAMPCGHICGADLNEERVTPDNERLLKKGMCVILHPTILNDTLETSIFWGESYLVTDDGYECVMDSSKELCIAE
ncbi:MAG: Xaa-Pro peptidase family protein [Clostridia bacterium]|nr:Xaa-Pro peptidase family protein [Clostridia bacterium]